MQVHVADHPLIKHKLTYLRDRRTDSPTFRRLAEELVTLLAYEATRHIRTAPMEINTPVTSTIGVRLADPKPVLVPILRAGLGMLEGMVRILPTAEVGFLGMVRDEETLDVSAYANRLPENLEGRQVFVVDPMLATGHTLVMSMDFLRARGAKDITCVCLIGSPEGLELLKEYGAKAEGEADIKIVLGAIDEKLDENGYIVPGLGDAGDRLYGVVHHGS
ncbi:uracil phosphoribosyltransferase [Dermatophilus congolensis]|uniref:uracil phosphoribosyltransferase n=1 Tax=Dermatophilus congolensis TaxID=1863 RepID=UPI0004872E7A|nr:uracil phosphoribosyltransferase [Dermatophilus congolensis]MBO3130617.1 uracil phosphoribosyltransferase [Dermatophilus congolensis]MBO3130753.1 uracil phosphoribosyltransferase [Dermatophilus congolensis]MBO3135090.1 uracil phosphoribosyltransferase [Dermatophilus congolensis]MBO3137329.1 uracil phosphoribosyltransferase [Dermatophilus congolensis]MBO3139571.1 uracil phosphoribosyltransferase [Dermatophilus congolensis]